MPQADKPDPTVAPKPCPPSLEADIPARPVRPAGAGIVKPPVGSKAAEATALHLDFDAAEADFIDEILPRVVTAKAYCQGR